MMKIHVFCFWFSVRLGTVVVGVLTLIHACISISIFALYLGDVEEFRALIDDYIENIETNKNILQYLSIDNASFVTVLVVFFSLFACACIVLLIGAFQCNYYLLWPFIALDFVFILLMTSQHIFFMLNMKDHDSDLGRLILYCNLGVFIILYYLYMWICVFSFGQIVKELKATVKANKPKKVVWVSSWQ